MTHRHPSDSEAEPQALASVLALEEVRAPAALRHSLEELVQSAPRKRPRRLPSRR
jgi:hypothetical protein